MAMDSTYRPMQNAHAIRRLYKPQYIPNDNLGVDGGEDLTSQPVLVFTDAYANLSNRYVPDMTLDAHEYSGMVGDGNTLTDADFIGEMWLGYPVEVI